MINDQPVHGTGRTPNEFMLVGSEPGWKEMVKGVPFVGPTGEEVDRLLQRIGFPRPLWFLTNYFRRPAPRIDGKALPHPGEDFEEAGHHLKEELRRVQPKLIVPLGREAIRYFLGDVDVDEVFGLHLHGLLCVNCCKPLHWNDSLENSPLRRVGAGSGLPIPVVATDISGLADTTNALTASRLSTTSVRSMTMSTSTISAETSGVSIPPTSNPSHSKKISGAGTPLARTAGGDILSTLKTPTFITGLLPIKGVDIAKLAATAKSVVVSNSATVVCACGSNVWRQVSLAPQVHPAAGFHSPEASNQVLVGFELLARILKGRTPARFLHDDPYPNPNYREVHTPEEFREWANDLSALFEVANDTEGSPRFPWSVQLSKADGEGILMRDSAVLEEFARWAKDAKPTMAFHHALHDARMNRVMGLDVFEAGIPYEDTMLMAYELGVIPQGLKSLAVRECAMPMLSYKEVLGDAQDRHARTYVQWLWDSLNDRYQRLRRQDFEFQTKVLGRRIKVLPKLPKPDLMKACERVLGAKEPARLWLNQVDDHHTEAYSILRAEMPEASLSDVDPQIALYYAGRDPDATRRLKKVLLPRVQEMGLEEVYRLDLGTYPLLDRMMAVGMMPDHAAFKRLAQVLDNELTTLRLKLEIITGRPGFNPNSGDQTADYVFETLGLDMLGKKTSTGRGSTNDKVLEALEKLYPEYPQLADIRSYREYYKLRWTFVERLPEMVERWPFDGAIHCELMLNRTPSGRLAAKNPNLLAMPKHGKFAKMFRACFVPRDGCLFLSLDESQIELRVGAHLSQDPVMLAIYRGELRNPDGSRIDMHTNMVRRVYGADVEETSSIRTAAKAINFGYWMGQTYVGLKLELQKAGLDVSDDDAQHMIDEANELYKGAGTYKQAMIAEAEKNGYIRCPLSGRIRYVGGIRSKDDRVRAEAERFAYSTPIQEGAQAIGKRVLASAWDSVYVPYRKQGRYIEPLLWTHDDLLSEVDQSLVLEVAPKLKAIMTTAPEGFSVPLDTKPEAGLNWADMVEL